MFVLLHFEGSSASEQTNLLSMFCSRPAKWNSSGLAVDVVRDPNTPTESLYAPHPISINPVIRYVREGEGESCSREGGEVSPWDATGMSPSACSSR